ncbi:MAG: dTDP-4-dehydrorhamnose 3,5-epimerase [Deltaproteobacteria bacterium]|nr:MAG: dTDP-4-dehydrorhamnose 3,5-epimerase [Deltaproteobacteria bacterium]
MKVVAGEIPGILIVEPKVFGDDRGHFFESFNERAWREATGLDVRFVQDNQSRSVRGVLRGLHYQIGKPQGKLVRVLAGEVFDVAVDLRRGSPTFGKWTGSLLSGDNRRQMWIPEGFAHGFCVTSESADFFYKCTDYYHPAGERGIVWNDPSIGIRWPVPRPILSDRDMRYPVLAARTPEDLP